MKPAPAYGWFGAGYATFKICELSSDHTPPEDTNSLKEWLQGFATAYADCPDLEAIEGILQGDFSKGESMEDALLRCAPAIYCLVSENQELAKEFDLTL